MRYARPSANSMLFLTLLRRSKSENEFISRAFMVRRTEKFIRNAHNHNQVIYDEDR